MPVEYLEFSTYFYKLFWVFLEKKTKRKWKRAVSLLSWAISLAFLQLTFANQQDRCSSNHRLLPSLCPIWLCSGPCKLTVCLLWALFSPENSLCFALNSCSTNQEVCGRSPDVCHKSMECSVIQGHVCDCIPASRPLWAAHHLPSLLSHPSFPQVYRFQFNAAVSVLYYPLH